MSRNYKTLDCRDGQHAACATCSCACHHSAVTSRLLQLAVEFDAAATTYSRYAGDHSALLQGEATRAGHQLRRAADLVTSGAWSESRGAVWVKAGWRIITAIGRANLK